MVYYCLVCKKHESEFVYCDTEYSHYHCGSSKCEEEIVRNAEKGNVCYTCGDEDELIRNFGGELCNWCVQCFSAALD